MSYTCFDKIGPSTLRVSRLLVTQRGPNHMTHKITVPGIHRERLFWLGGITYENLCLGSLRTAYFGKV